ncbi:MAG: hypothetical protein C0417_05265 [Chlorobiaceae bacterium]|nr:hypothetical protein [Chlorobiaceae bacterium]
MGFVRKFKQDDIETVIDLNTRLFPESASLSKEAQRNIFEDVCFRNPWFDEEISSLVHVESDGRISGFLGVIPRKMVFDGKNIRVAVGQHLMADRSTLASFQLFRSFMSGPQDLSMTDMAIDHARIIWERRNGSVVYLHSIYWRKPLRPFRFAMSYLTKEKNLSPIFKFSTPIWTLLDSVLNKIPNSPFRQTKINISAEQLSEEQFLNNIDQYIQNHKLKPAYTSDSIRWLFKTLGNEKRFGTFQHTLLRNDDGNIIGWYLYNLKPKGRSEVIQIVSDKHSIKSVLEHLFHHAWSSGSVELCGRLDPQYMKEFSDKYCLFMPGRNWMLVHSNNSEISNTILKGDAFLSRLEGDLWFF